MKNINTIVMLIATILLASCEKTVGIELDDHPPKLVVDAAINWEKGTAGNLQKIKLTTTTSYFSYTIPSVSGAEVSVSNSVGSTFSFVETPNTGEYVCETFIPELGETYTLNIVYNGQMLTATEIMKPVPEIDRVEQELSPGIGSEDDRIDLKTYYTDPGNSADFYMMRVQTSINAIPQFYVTDDEFFQGNQIFAIYINPNLMSGNIAEIKLYGISQRYFNYMTILAGISGANGGGPFSTPPATLRGNVYNTTNPDNFALGYFSVSEIDKEIYTVQ